MKNFLAFLLISFISISCSNKNPTVTIRVISKTVPDTSNVYISGTLPELGAWQPDSVMLTKINDSTFEYSFELDTIKHIEYKFTLGSWENEALNKQGFVPQNYTADVTGDTLFSHKIPGWRGDESYAPYGQITGNVEYIRDMQYKNLLPRDVIIWLPPGYNDNPNKRYPVMYMHDGQNIIDPKTSSFGIDWGIDETADSLIRNGYIEPFIVVGNSSTANRTPEYTVTDTTPVYMDFVVNYLKPEIDKRYRTKPDRENTIIGGSSFGGLISFRLIWTYPEVFSKAMCMSPAFQYTKNKRYIDYLAMMDNELTPMRKKITIYMDNGGVDLEELIQPGIENMAAKLDELGLEYKKDYYFYVFPDASHFEYDWGERLWIPLKMFFGKEKGEIYASEKLYR